MDQAVKEHLFNIQFGKLFEVKNMAVIPLYINLNDHGPQYIVLKEAMEEKLLIIKEVSEGGSVSELQVLNEADLPVLVLDGEELIGARQNRVLNTTILLKQKMGTVIPVSCTEHGRWSYKTRVFSHSESYMPYELRKKKNRAVLEALKHRNQHFSDQGEIWEGIECMARAMKVESITEDMKHMFDVKKADLDEYVKGFECQAGQTGLLVFINGEIAGFDMVSRPEAYRELHANLLRSYAMDAMLTRKEEVTSPSLEKAQAFLHDISNCKEEKYEAVGYGNDYRYEANTVIGSALVFENKVIHSVFHRIYDDKPSRKL